MFFRPGVFDGAISISAIQWLCNADKSYHEPHKRLNKFFTSLYQCLCRGARCIFQFYPENANQMEMITNAAMRAGFCGGLVVDFPHSAKAKKYFLCLWAGSPPGGFQLPQGLGEEETTQETIQYSNARESSNSRKSKRPPVKSREWIRNKKDSQRKKGKDVRPDSKYTGRKRPSKM